LTQKKKKTKKKKKKKKTKKKKKPTNPQRGRISARHPNNPKKQKKKIFGGREAYLCLFSVEWSCGLQALPKRKTSFKEALILWLSWTLTHFRRGRKDMEKIRLFPGWGVMDSQL